jgi:hypothetical protein
VSQRVVAADCMGGGRPGAPLHGGRQRQIRGAVPSHGARVLEVRMHLPPAASQERTSHRVTRRNVTLGNPTLTAELKERLAAGITAETAGRGIAEF